MKEEVWYCENCKENFIIKENKETKNCPLCKKDNTSYQSNSLFNLAKTLDDTFLSFAKNQDGDS